MKLILKSTLSGLIGIGIATACCSMQKANNSPFDAIVAQDGSGNYKSVQAAINATPDSLSKPWLIFIKNGSYEEHVVIPATKPHIHLIGQCKERTIIHLHLNVGGKPENPDEEYWKYSVHNPASSIYRKEGSVVTINATDFYTENISYVNDYGVEAQNGPQALAMKSHADRAAFNNCIFRSFQDTWMTTKKDNERHYVNNCWIEGAVDYLFGGGDVLIENSTLYNVRSGSVIVAPCHTEAKFGYVFRDCIIDGNESAADGRLSLGRPWHNNPMARYINTTMRIPVLEEGWTEMGTSPGIFAEYGSHDISGNELDLSKRKTEYTYTRNGERVTGKSRCTIDANEISLLTYENMFPENGDWNPRSMMYALPAPAKVEVKEKEVIWDDVAEAKGYIILDDENVIGFSTTNVYTLNSKPTGNVRVRAVNAYGALGLSQ